MGYPGGAPAGFAPVPSRQGILHTLFSIVVFASLTAASIVYARRFWAQPGGRRWAIYSAFTGLAMPVFFLAQAAGSAPQANNLTQLAGLFQRIAIVLGWGWVALLAMRLVADLETVAQSEAELQ
jgi:hypothetical protein